MRPNWELNNCCNHEQLVFLITVSVCAVVILAVRLSSFTSRSNFLLIETDQNLLQHWIGGIPHLLWRTILLKPFKLVTVFIHEASHAIACKLTCGHVEGIKVNVDEGGTTQTRGGIYWLILPAGYLGSSFWGMVLILASTNLLTARIAAGCFLAALLVTLIVAKNVNLGSSFWGMVLILASTNLLTARIAAGCFLAALLVTLIVAKNWTLRGLCIGFIVFLGVIWVLQETTKVRILRYVILFIDIYDDLISRRVHSSDAEKFAEVCPCPCNGVGWGIIW
ncbi:hypothetical protein CJ030_MR5G019109 [Morella rubra]|uniref:Peptidase M50B-like protein n=1 Tax=Morella rubra TaxID=262757 RepID=A0A6A1VKZ8_9ROSI|nr:hypothetical protein CJ030_MR5G019109 [Morella rubra]